MKNKDAMTMEQIIEMRTSCEAEFLFGEFSSDLDKNRIPCKKERAFIRRWIEICRDNPVKVFNAVVPDGNTEYEKAFNEIMNKTLG